MSIISLRDYQLDQVSEIVSAWKSGFQNVMPQLATGGGKTVIISYILASLNVPFIVIAHRAEILSQISLTLTKFNLTHDIIAPRPIVRNIIKLHHSVLKRSSYRPGCTNLIASVDTLIKQQDSRFRHIKIVVQDEGHHVLKNNKWGKAAAMFPEANGLYPTATPTRADGRGLGRHADGIIDKLIETITMRDLINAGHLTDYRLLGAPSDIDTSTVKLSASGDYSPAPLRAATRKSHIVGDVVAHYLKHAAGKSGITFTVDVQTATEIAASYRQSGVPAEVICADTPDLVRAALIEKFRNKQILQLVNVDLLGEGVDVPAIEVVSMARPTQSYTVYCQQFGRALRPLPGKSHALIIDHVDNWKRHGLPDRLRVWTLDRRDRKSSSISIHLRTCLNPMCLAVYSPKHRCCPHCDYVTPVQERSSPEQVEGDLTELSPEYLRTLRAEIARIDGDAKFPASANRVIQLAIAKRHRERQDNQKSLRNWIALYAGWKQIQNKTDSEIYRLFYADFQIDILTAQTLGVKDAESLATKIEMMLDINSVVNREEADIQR